MRPKAIKNQTILLSPLNWGMGHVTRCIALIHQLLEQKNKVIIACSKEQEEIFRNYFPELLYENQEGYPFRFAGSGNFEKDLFFRFFPLYRRFHREKKEVEKLVKKHKIELVLSDHRYGFFSKKCTSIFITHQVNLPVSPYLKLIDKLHKKLLKSFSSIWILDTPDSKFAGKLSTNNHFKNVEYIGCYSRFSLYEKTEKVLPLVIIISGPEPYAKQFFKQQFELANKKSEKTVFIVPQNYPTKSQCKQVEIFPSIDWKLTDSIILQAEKIVSRSGYSTIMDLTVLEAENELFATKGQKEQGYLLKLQEGKN